MHNETLMNVMVADTLLNRDTYRFLYILASKILYYSRITVFIIVRLVIAKTKYHAFRRYSGPITFFSHFVILQPYAKIIYIYLALINLHSIPHDDKVKTGFLLIY